MPAAVNVDWSTDWEHALVTGNGRQGVACYGGPPALRLTLSHERLFLPVDEPLAPPATGTVLGRLRALCLAGSYQEAADEVVALAVAEDPRYRSLRQIDPFVGAATLTFIPHGRATQEWEREVDHGSGLVRQGSPDGHRHEVFVSRVDDVVVARLSAGGAPFDGRLHLGPIHGAPPRPIEFRSNGLSLTGRFPSPWPGGVTGYVTAVRVATTGGTVRAYPGVVDVHSVHEVLLIVRTVVSPADDEDVAAALADLPDDFDALFAAHAPEHARLFDRCRLTLDGSHVERLFDAGRYAIICASGERPPNLQGVWSGTFDPPWRSGYTLDGNLAAAVSALGPTGTPELLLPVFDLLDSLVDDFRENARRLYDAPGIVLPPHVSTHGRHNHFGSWWCLTFWTAGAAWASRLYYDYWRYTGDGAFLASRAWPFMREAASFYAAFVDDSDGQLRFVPSYSPENSPCSEDGPQASVNATMDVAAVRDLLRNLLTMAPRDAHAPIWRGMLDRLPPYRVGADGSLAEWLWPGLPDNHAHRHASHLFGLWYEPDPVILDDPVLRAAAVTAVRRRLAWWLEAGDEMAFGLCQLGLAAAALGLHDEAYECVSRLADRYWRSNLVSTHNADAIFNVDICGGLPAVIIAMLVARRGDTVELLPALPAEWPRGEIRGVLLRGGLTVTRLAWSPGSVSVALRARRVPGGPWRSETEFVEEGSPIDTPSVKIHAPAGRTVHATFSWEDR